MTPHRLMALGIGNVQVPHRRRDRRVAQHLLDLGHVNPAFEEVRRARVAELVQRDPPRGRPRRQ